MDKEFIKEMAECVNNVVLTTAKPYQEQIKQLQAKIKELKELVFERLNSKSHENHIHYHGGCLFCDIEQILL